MWINYSSKISVDPERIYNYIVDHPTMKETWKDDYYDVIYNVYPLLRNVDYVNEDDMYELYKQVNYELKINNKL